MFSSVSRIAASGLRVASQQLATSAHNVANVSTDNFQPQRLVAQEQAGGGVQARLETPTRTTTRPQGADFSTSAEQLSASSGTGLARETVNQIQAVRAFEANLATLRASDAMNHFLVQIKK